MQAFVAWPQVPGHLARYGSLLSGPCRCSIRTGMGQQGGCSLQAPSSRVNHRSNAATLIRAFAPGSEPDPEVSASPMSSPPKRVSPRRDWRVHCTFRSEAACSGRGARLSRWPPPTRSTRLRFGPLDATLFSIARPPASEKAGAQVRRYHDPGHFNTSGVHTARRTRQRDGRV